MRQLLHLILFGEQEAVSAIFAEDSSGNKMTLSDTAGIDELDAAAKARSLMHTPAISRLGFAVQFVVQSLRGAEGHGRAHPCASSCGAAPPSIQMPGLPTVTLLMNFGQGPQ